MKQNSMKRKINVVVMILGILAAILSATLPFVRMVVSPDTTVMILTAVCVIFVLTMFGMILLLLLNRQIIVKLTALPVTYAIVMGGYMLYKLNVHNIFKMMLGVEVANPEQVLSSTGSLGSLSMMLHGGVFVCSIPLIVAGIVKIFKLNKRFHQDFDTFDTSKGIILNVIDMHTRVNKTKTYRITLNVPYYQGEGYEVTKEFLIPVHMLHTIGIGSEVSLKINPNKREDVYIQNEYGIL